MKPSSHDDRLVDVTEELVNLTLLTRGCPDYLRRALSHEQLVDTSIARHDLKRLGVRP